MRWVWLLFLPMLLGLTPTHNSYESESLSRGEFRNVTDNAQDRQFRIVSSTPVLSELRDGEIVIVSSGTYGKVMFRSNQEIYAVDASCVTVRR